MGACRGFGVYVYHPEYGGDPGHAESDTCEDCGRDECVHRLDPGYDPMGQGGDLCHECAGRRMNGRRPQARSAGNSEEQT